ncbi:MAG: sensor histidine kinase [Bacteroidota bacterium]|nr:sensor histidine kinase [Bacteroidota bacterium]
MKLTVKNILKSKYLYIVLVGTIISLLLHAIAPIEKSDKIDLGKFYSIILCILITFIIWEGSMFIDKLMNTKFPWDKKPLKRAIAQSLFGILFSVLIIYTGTYLFDRLICKFPDDSKNKMGIAGLVVGSLVTLILMATQIGTFFFINWKTSLVDIEKYKKESVEAQLENLKSQVNPHFLFNNLSVLSSLVYKDQDKAVDFINQFSKVYRYILDHKSKELIELETELKFIESYCYLLKIRFGEGIKFNFDVSTEKLQLLLPPMALQLLIENTIKHNETSLEMPLNVDIYTKGDYLIVSNNLQVRHLNEESSRTGLKNIMSRYRHYSKMEVHIHTSEKMFEVQLPLLKSL